MCVQLCGPNTDREKREKVRELWICVLCAYELKRGVNDFSSLPPMQGNTEAQDTHILYVLAFHPEKHQMHAH